MSGIKKKTLKYFFGMFCDNYCSPQNNGVSPMELNKGVLIFITVNDNQYISNLLLVKIILIM